MVVTYKKRTAPKKKQPKASIWTPANVVTLSRIVLVPLWLLLAELVRLGVDGSRPRAGTIGALVSFGLYVFISLTDKLDGWLARSRGEVTDFGKFLDPIADKLSVVMGLVYLLELGLVPSWMLLVVTAREFVVSGMRMVVAAKGTVVAASNLGKAKTATTMVGICGLLLYASTSAGVLDTPILAISNVCLYGAMALTMWSGADYIVKAWPLLTEAE